jgi:hypothetical protein
MRWTQELRWWRCAGLLLRDSRRLAPALRPWLIAAPTGCTPAQVRLKEFGSELIEVADNGCGVSPSDYSALAAKYHTSKVSCSLTQMLTRCRHSLPAVCCPTAARVHGPDKSCHLWLPRRGAQLPVRPVRAQRGDADRDRGALPSALVTWTTRLTRGPPLSRRREPGWSMTPWGA